MTKSLRQGYENILEVMNKYYEAQVKGDSGILKPVCHKNAIMHGLAGDILLEGSIENLFAFIDKTGAQPELKARFDVITLEETIAKTVNWYYNNQVRNYEWIAENGRY